MHESREQQEQIVYQPLGIAQEESGVLNRIRSRPWVATSLAALAFMGAKEGIALAQTSPDANNNTSSGQQSIDNWVVKNCLDRAIGIPLFHNGTPTPLVERAKPHYTLGSRRVTVGLRLRYLQSANAFGEWVDCSQGDSADVTLQMQRSGLHKPKKVGRLAKVTIGEITTNFTDGNINRAVSETVTLTLDRPFSKKDLKLTRGRHRHSHTGVSIITTASPKVQPEFQGSTAENPVPIQFYDNGYCVDPNNPGAKYNGFCAGYPQNLATESKTKTWWATSKEVKTHKH